MSTIFSGLNLALRALMAHQQAQLVTDHNVANANTPGYTRQEAILSPDAPYTRSAFNRPEIGLHLGLGAFVSRIRRFNLEFFDGRLRAEMAATSNWDERAAILKQVEALLPEGDNSGLGDKLDQFWSAWQGLSGDPANTALRTSVAYAGANLAAMLRDRYNALTATRRDEDALVVSLVGDVNTQASQIAGLNQQILRAVGAGDDPNDLLDRRDVLLDELAQIAGATVNFQTNGDALVSIGGHILAAGGGTAALSATPDAGNPGMVKIVWADGQAAAITSGRIAGALTARDSDIPARTTALNTLASTLVTQVNAIHTTAFGLPPGNVTGLNFFTGTNAADIAVNPTIANDLTQLGAAGAADQPGDGSKALAVAQLANSLLMSSGTRTINGFWADAVAQLGLDAGRAEAEGQTHALVRAGLTQQKQSVTGVSLDEEAARLVQSQRAYEAAARVLTAFDEMADTVIHRMGIVGR